MHRSLISVVAAVGMFWATGALAYWTGATAVGGVELKEGPGSQFRTVRVLPKGTSFNATDTPQQGYYRVRTPGESGWIDSAQIGGPGGASRSAAQPQAQQSRPVSRPPRQHARRDSRGNYTGSRVNRSNEGPRWAISGLFNLDFYSPSDLNTLLGTSDFSGGAAFGASVIYFFKPDLGLGLRIEKLGKSVNGNDTSTNDTFTFNLSSTSIAAGGEYVFWKQNGLSLNGELWLGMAPTSFSTTATASTDTTKPSTDGAPYTVDLSATAMTAIIGLDGEWAFAPPFSATAELGYRYLKTSALTPTTTATLSNTIFRGQSTYAIDLSGPFVGLGLRISF